MSTGPGLGREEAAMAAKLRRLWPVSAPADSLDQSVLAHARGVRAGRPRARTRLPWLLASAAAAVLAVATVLRLGVTPGPAPTDDTGASDMVAPSAPPIPASAPLTAADRRAVAGSAEAAAPERASPRAPPATGRVRAAERPTAEAAPPAPPSSPARQGRQGQEVAVPATTPAESELAAAVALLEAGKPAEAAAAARELLRRWPEAELPEPLRALLADPPPTE